MSSSAISFAELEVTIPFMGGRLSGQLSVPGEAKGLIIFAHGSGSSRHSPRNKLVAEVLQQRQLGTLLFDLLTADEERAEANTGHLRFNIGFLAGRLQLATEWVLREGGEIVRDLPLGYFGASTGAAAALVASVSFPRQVKAVVSRGGRPDLAGETLREVIAPTLLIVGGDDEQVLELNSEAYQKLSPPKELEIVAGATHLFSEPGTLEKAADLAAQWFTTYL
jgi:putative phosphoribosyl transferase